MCCLGRQIVETNIMVAPVRAQAQARIRACRLVAAARVVAHRQPSQGLAVVALVCSRNNIQSRAGRDSGSQIASGIVE
eukprot:COSAG02_NODE_582_length_20017_cov_26.599608_9_plen_78_part_00